ncbi:MAG TPA: hypothetical protein V6D19_07160 [Stenomitos sp.]
MTAGIDGTPDYRDRLASPDRKAIASLRRGLNMDEFTGWAILEIMGHRRLGGFLSEQAIAGGKMLRIDIPGPNETKTSQFYNIGSVYSVTPCAEEIAKAFALKHQPEPVARWELPQLPNAVIQSADTSFDEDDDVLF